MIPLDAKAPVYITEPDNPAECVRSEYAYVSHFATCPKANEFSESKRKAKL